MSWEFMTVDFECAAGVEIGSNDQDAPGSDALEALLGVMGFLFGR
jgi:hypothetical protein